jgi:hypothetical protein
MRKVMTLWFGIRASLLRCANREMLRAGQIGLLGRLKGHAPIW